MRGTRLPLESMTRGERTLGRDEAHYLTVVRRLAEGDRFVAFDPDAGLEAEARVLSAERGRVVVELDEPVEPGAIPGPRVCLVQAVGKGDKLDQVARDATELGVDRIAPAIASRSVARRDSEASRARLRRVVVEASRQCGRGRAPTLDPARPLAEVLASCDAEKRLLLHPGRGRPIGRALEGLGGLASLAIAVGPEGGFDEEELAAAEAAGFEIVHLGPLVLRTETVAAAVLGAIRVLSELR